jgi:3-oxoacyl-[acyl-carrier-protein] synthase-1
MPNPQYSSTAAIAITGMGMVSSLGHDVRTGNAAARAGITRSAELDDFQYRSIETGEVEGLIGHPVSILTDGFEGDARLLQLANAGLIDLQRQVSHAPWLKANTGFYLSLPDPLRTYTCLNLITDEEDRKSLEKKAKVAEEEQPEKNRAQNLLLKAAQLNEWSIKPPLRFVTTSGHTGISEALKMAVLELSTGLVDGAIVGGVDSLLEEDTLGWLHNTGRLKTSGTDVGLQPGEAAAFLLIENIQNARTRKARIFAIVYDVQIGEESKSLVTGEPPTGQGLKGVLTGIMQNEEWQDTGPIWLVSDQNGEHYRAMDWGNAIVRLLTVEEAFARAIMWYPTASFGDTCAASGAVSLCNALCAFGRGYAPANRVAVISSADGPSRAAMLVGTLDH